MTTTRDVMSQFARYVEQKDFISAFSMLNDDGKYTVIGTTPISKTYHGKCELIDGIMQVMAERFIVPPTLKFSHVIVDGHEGFLRAAGDGTAVGVGNRPYNQPYYAWYARVENDGFAELIEYFDTLAIETQLFGKTLV